MQVRVFTAYALRVLRYLAVHGQEAQTGPHIAREIGITYANFAQTATKLAHCGLISSVDGRYGGYFLAKPAHDISLYDVFCAIEGELQMSPYSLEQKSLSANGQNTQIFLSQFQSRMIAELSSKSIADLGEEYTMTNERG